MGNFINFSGFNFRGRKLKISKAQIKNNPWDSSDEEPAGGWTTPTTRIKYKKGAHNTDDLDEDEMDFGTPRTSGKYIWQRRKRTRKRKITKRKQTLNQKRSRKKKKLRSRRL